MRSVVYLGQMLEVQMRVDLGGRDAGVPEQFLHRAQVAARLQKMRCERVPQHVWVHAHGEATISRELPQAQLDGASADAAAMPIEK